MARKQNNRPPRERKPREKHLKVFLNEIIDVDTKRKLEALRDELARERQCQ